MFDALAHISRRAVPLLDIACGSSCSKQNLEAMRAGTVDPSPYTAHNFTTVLGAMKDVGADWIDVLKIDIEGEFTVCFHKCTSSKLQRQDACNRTCADLPGASQLLLTQMLRTMHRQRVARVP